MSRDCIFNIGKNSYVRSRQFMLNVYIKFFTNNPILQQYI